MDSLENAENVFDEALNSLLIETAKEAYREGVIDALDMRFSPLDSVKIEQELLGDDPENILGRNETGV